VRNDSNRLSLWLSLAAERSSRGVQQRAWQEDETMSSFTTTCGNATILAPIEPLAGALRHPYHNCIKHSSYSGSKEYLIPALALEVLPLPRRTFLFDCGASLHKSGSGGASQEWFVRTYRQSGLAFTHILAWEFTHHSDEEILRPLPAALRQGTSIYRDPNTTVSGHDKLSYFNFGIDSTPTSLRNPLLHLRSLAKPEDFVVFKLDIDTPAIELSIVQQILADPHGVGRLIDEFYWEHVVVNTPMQNFGWRHDLRRVPPRERQTLRDSYRFFRELREMGIRAHSWV